MLCDCIVCGINDNAIQRCLLAELGLTFIKSLKIAQSLEAITRHMHKLHPAAAGSSKRKTSTSSNEINKLTKQNPTQVNQKQCVAFVASQDTNQQTVVIKKQVVISVVKLAT